MCVFVTGGMRQREREGERGVWGVGGGAWKVLCNS